MPKTVSRRERVLDTPSCLRFIEHEIPRRYRNVTRYCNGSGVTVTAQALQLIVTIGYIYGVNLKVYFTREEYYAKVWPWINLKQQMLNQKSSPSVVKSVQLNTPN